LLQLPLPLHPQVPPPLHWLPLGDVEQSEAHVPPEQQPPLHLEVVLHDAEHAPPLQAFPVGQSPGAPHPQAPFGWHLSPLDTPEQLTHAPPEGAHVESPMPAHMPPLQQKPVPHVPSAPPPHAALQLPFVPHVGFWPLHPVQIWPLVPHAALSPPATHVPALQQPPLHCADPLHAFEHTTPLHAVPTAQSAGPPQPHAVPTHLVPLDAEEQSTQLPGVPQLAVVPRHVAPMSIDMTSAGASFTVASLVASWLVSAAGPSCVASPPPPPPLLLPLLLLPIVTSAGPPSAPPPSGASASPCSSRPHAVNTAATKNPARSWRVVTP
jgi:hypothetical protein